MLDRTNLLVDISEKAGRISELNQRVAELEADSSE